ncbi:MAG: 3-dehydroquinate synthase, partial [Clostridia bacterium]|nr:3-dehydroquinate synthase [Clostridia bacterium]
VTVNASTTYPILIGDGLLDQAGALCAEHIGICRVCVVTDDTVHGLYYDRLRRSLEAAGYAPLLFVIPHGEGSKNMESLCALLEFCAENRLTRSDALIALGGGVVGDLCGFAAAVYLRGVPFVQIPTTLLAAVDSSVGGKTAVDLRAGKNLAGACHQPSLVICDCRTTDTLPQKIFADGCAEIIKYGVINDRPFFERLKSGIAEHLEEVIATCVANKRDVVEGDEFDRGARQLLNLGHTVGHAIELCSELVISHGSAVAMGMVIVTRAAVAMGLCPKADLQELIALLQANHLPVECPFDAKELASAASADKKRAGDMLSLVVPYGIGDSRLYRLPVASLTDFIAKGLERS